MFLSGFALCYEDDEEGDDDEELDEDASLILGLCFFFFQITLTLETEFGWRNEIAKN